jgi:hypothetical protein
VTAHTYVSCEVRTSSTYKEVKLSPEQVVTVHTYVSSEVRTASTYKEVKLSL